MAALASRLLCLALLSVYSTAFAIPTPSDITSPRDVEGFTIDVIHGGRELGPVLDQNFPDPSIIQGRDGKWYAFATNNGDTTVQIARADDPLGRWELLGYDAMPNHAWTSGSNTWAPDVRELADGSYILYFTGEIPGSHQHCIGVARSADIEGPYEPDPEPWVCPLEQGGAIDASGYLDEATGNRYVVYKVDGNSMGIPTECGEGVDDVLMRTPLMLQRVDAADGATKIGDAIVLLDRVPELDGPLIEAPNLVRRREDGMYVLFYSSHCFSDPRYDVKYAYSESVEGPYTRALEALVQAPEMALDGPGGMTASRIAGQEEDGADGADGADGVDFIVFHANCLDKGRCMYAVRYGDEVSQ